jgi:hypothetical protein
MSAISIDSEEEGAKIQTAAEQTVYISRFGSKEKSLACRDFMPQPVTLRHC